MRLALTDKIIKKYMDEQGITDFLDCSNESDGLAMAGGYWLATGKRADVFFSADGLCNALNFLTSWIIPEGIEMNLFISTGRQESPHKVMSDIYDDLIKLIPFDAKRISITTVRK